MGYSQDIFMKESVKALNNIAKELHCLNDILSKRLDESDIAYVEELERQISERFNIDYRKNRRPLDNPEPFSI